MSDKKFIEENGKRFEVSDELPDGADPADYQFVREVTEEKDLPALLPSDLVVGMADDKQKVIGFFVGYGVDGSLQLRDVILDGFWWIRPSKVRRIWRSGILLQEQQQNA
jgi:hypothetical protein